ncbi:hypothetical protein P280DRAFT_62399 [Massarina eburnea CBS 473.64]|uniref:Uncharacterized protein n=1 Tax=Massarina eburnea CBS 473.64 TaxID=1395130 RepID=A0A6A6RX62_9PLEO|nr:hypothetical protein P280DRAFT_62399 [Massarina eburnea CBS 473.64]
MCVGGITYVGSGLHVRGGPSFWKLCGSCALRRRKDPPATPHQQPPPAARRALHLIVAPAHRRAAPAPPARPSSLHHPQVVPQVPQTVTPTQFPSSLLSVNGLWSCTGRFACRLPYSLAVSGGSVPNACWPSARRLAP